MCVCVCTGNGKSDKRKSERERERNPCKCIDKICVYVVNDMNCERTRMSCEWVDGWVDGWVCVQCDCFGLSICEEMSYEDFHFLLFQVLFPPFKCISLSMVFMDF